MTTFLEFMPIIIVFVLVFIPGTILIIRDIVIHSPEYKRHKHKKSHHKAHS